MIYIHSAVSEELPDDMDTVRVVSLRHNQFIAQDAASSIPFSLQDPYMDVAYVPVKTFYRSTVDERGEYKTETFKVALHPDIHEMLLTSLEVADQEAVNTINEIHGYKEKIRDLVNETQALSTALKAELNATLWQRIKLVFTRRGGTNDV